MKKLDLGQTVNTLANLGVIAGIIFLVIEMQQNNALLANQARSELADRRARFIEMMIQYPDVSELLTKVANGQELTTAEQLRFDQLGRRLFASWESQFLEVEQGTVPLDSLPIRQWRVIFFGTRPPDFHLQAAWEGYRQEAMPRFAEFVETNIVKPGPPEDAE